MDVKERLLSGRRARTIFVRALLVIALASLLFSEFVLPGMAQSDPWTGKYYDPWVRTFSSVLNAVFQVSLTTLLVTLAFLWLVPRDLREGQVIMVDSDDIGLNLAEHLGTTSRYWFRGRSGRWVREDVIPQLARRAAKNGSKIVLTMIIPDPANASLMKSYSDYRKSIVFKGADEEWTADMVTAHVLATIVAAYFSTSTTKFLDLNIGLVGWFSAYRLDVTDESAMLTVEDPKNPALRFAKSSIMYRTHVAEIEQNLEHSRRLPKPPAAFLGRGCDEAFVIDVLKHVKLEKLLCDEITAKTILDRIEKLSKPYG